MEIFQLVLRRSFPEPERRSPLPKSQRRCSLPKPHGRGPLLRVCCDVILDLILPLAKPHGRRGPLIHLLLFLLISAPLTEPQRCPLAKSHRRFLRKELAVPKVPLAKSHRRCPKSARGALLHARWLTLTEAQRGALAEAQGRPLERHVAAGEVAVRFLGRLQLRLEAGHGAGGQVEQDETVETPTGHHHLEDKTRNIRHM